MKRIKNILIAILVTGMALPVHGQKILPKRKYKAYRTEQAPVINGELDDQAWSGNHWEGGFTQNEPYEGRLPSQDTEFKICYDDVNLYVAIKAYDTAVDSITNRLTRRDNGDGDMVFVLLDSYHDLRTGFVFGVSSAGVRFDMIMANDGMNEDPSWDPIWQAKARIHTWGWSAEMKIPFTQLRFQKNSDDVWGLEVARQLYRHSEMSFWQHVPRDASGLIHAVGELEGLGEVQPRKQFDFTPYVVGAYNTYEAEEGNPFADGRDPKGKIGFDAKIGVTNNLTLDLTVFPDFGQVEADPSEVNLSAYETYFDEKRPFFIEGSSITSFNVGLGDGDAGNDNLFYSRRIGRRPHYSPDLDDDEYADVPHFTDIIGAAKLTGKTEGGWSIGVLETVTRKVEAEIDYLGNRSSEVIEPLTNYSLARVQKDFNGGNTIIGAAATNTTRLLDDTDLDWLHSNATTAGADFIQMFNERNYRLSASLYFSNVQGSAEAIKRTQESSARYFQRPDNDYVNYDTTRTNLTGHGGKLEFGKIGGKWNFIFMNIWKSPGLEINDMGYMREADNLISVLWSGYNFTEPFSIFRSLRFGGNFYTVFDFGGNNNGSGFEGNTGASFKNFWSLSTGGGISFDQTSTAMLRGGPSMKIPNEWRMWYNISSDQRKKVSAHLNGFLARGQEDQERTNSYSLSVIVRPMNTLSLTVSPSISRVRNDFQYLTSMNLNGEDRYIFGTLKQQIISMSLRVNYTITPDLTIQYWGQPFTGDIQFTNYKIIEDPGADKFSARYYEYTDAEISNVDDKYYVSTADYDFDFEDPDFKANEWLSNLVVRWEFLPGSTAYLVWSQNRDYYGGPGEYNFGENLDYLFTDKKANNTFLVKFSYRFGL